MLLNKIYTSIITRYYNLLQPLTKWIKKVVQSCSKKKQSCSKIEKSNTICNKHAKNCLTNHYKQKPPCLYRVGCSGCSGCTAKQCLCLNKG